MYISRLTLKAQNSYQWFKVLKKNQYQWHQVLWPLFEGQSLRHHSHDQKPWADFLYRVDLSENQPTVYVVSARKMQTEHSLWQIDSKPYQPQLYPGQTLFFSLRANPTLKHRGKRHSVITHAKKIFKQQLQATQNRLPEPYELWQVTQQTAYQWLDKQSLGIQLKAPLRIEHHDEYLHKNKAPAPICYTAIDYQGSCTVNDPKRFKQALYQGVGKSRRFGCGLILIKPA